MPAAKLLNDKPDLENGFAHYIHNKILFFRQAAFQVGIIGVIIDLRGGFRGGVLAVVFVHIGPDAQQQRNGQ